MKRNVENIRYKGLSSAHYIEIPKECIYIVHIYAYISQNIIKDVKTQHLKPDVPLSSCFASSQTLDSMTITWLLKGIEETKDIYLIDKH